MIRSIAIAVLAAACSGTTSYVGQAQHPIVGTLPASTKVDNDPKTGHEKVVGTQTKTPASQPAPNGGAQ